MTTLETILRRIQTELDGQRKKWSVVGGLAVVVRGEPRFTRDADLAVAVGGDAEAESLVRWLQGRGYGVLATVEQQATGRLATVRLLPPGEDAEGIAVSDGTQLLRSKEELESRCGGRAGTRRGEQEY